MNKTERIRQYTESMDFRIDILQKYMDGQVLSEFERECLWVIAGEITSSRAYRHYRQKQTYGKYVHGGRRCVFSPNSRQEYVLYSERIISFLEFVRQYSTQTPQWVVFVYKRRFPEIEERMRLRLYGLTGIPVVPYLKWSKVFRLAHREGLESVEEITTFSFTQYPVKDTRKSFKKRKALIEKYLEIFNTVEHYRRGSV